MSGTLANPSALAPRVNAEQKSPENPTAKLTEPRMWLREVGQCLFRARMSLGWTLDQTAAELGRDARQVGRWERGEERTQVDTVFSCEAIREAFGRELATLSGAKVLLLFGKAG